MNSSPVTQYAADYEALRRRDIEAALQEAEDAEAVWFDTLTVIKDVAAIFAEVSAEE